ncbi:MFS transporter [Leifsonia lichenia]
MSASSTQVGKPNRQLGLAVFSGFFGSVLEFYDFFLYATASALVFNQVFFPELDPVVGTIASFGTLAAGYFARPLGGIIFGHFGDKLGRKRMLVWTMSLMAGASIVIGLLPGAAQIGVAAPLLLTFFRVVQGIALGGEWAGSALISAEHATSRRGLWASFTQAGAPSGSVLSTAMLALVSALTTQQQFLAWGWRIPFLFSVVLLAGGLIIRSKVHETPIFLAAVKEAPKRRFPLGDVLRYEWRPLLLVLGVSIAGSVCSAVLTTFVLAFATGHGFERQTVLNVLLLSSFITALFMLFYGSLSDRFGRRPVMIAGTIGLIIMSFVLFPAIGSGSVLALAIVLPVNQAVVHAALAGPQPAMVTEQFSTVSRFTGASVSYQLAGIFGGLTPLVFASVLQANGGSTTLPLSIIMSVTCVVALFCLLALKETSQKSLSDSSPAVEHSAAVPDTTQAPA